MKRRTRCGALVLACAFLLALPSGASAKVFLELQGIQGESTVVGFENQMELQSFQFGVGKRDKAAASFSEITVTKNLDKASPELMLRTANGVIIPSAKVRFTKSSDAGETTFLRYCFTGVRITSFSQGSGGDTPTDSFSFNYGTIVQSYTQQDTGGGQGTVFSSGWDVLKNLQIAGACQG